MENPPLVQMYEQKAEKIPGKKIKKWQQDESVFMMKAGSGEGDFAASGRGKDKTGFWQRKRGPKMKKKLFIYVIRRRFCH